MKKGIDPSTMLQRGARTWNRWRDANPGPLLFSRPHWFDSPGPRGVQIKGGNRVDFSGMTLSGLTIHSAFAEGLTARNAVVDGSHFEEGDFSRADFRGTEFRNTKFNKTVLTHANFDGASFVNCSLHRVNLAGASFRVKEIRETVVYGVSAWDLTTSDASKQSKLVIENTYELYSALIEQGKLPITVDDIELAQFVHYLSDHRKIRNSLEVLNASGVLLLGRFGNGGLDRLHKLRAFFARKNMNAMIFDFERPKSLSLTETVVTMAGLAKFLVVDLSGPSVPAELQSILSQVKKPVLAFGDPYAMFPDLEDQTSVLTVDEDEPDLLAAIEAKLPLLEQLHAERVRRLAARYSKDRSGPPRTATRSAAPRGPARRGR